MRPLGFLILFLFSCNLLARTADDNLTWQLAQERKAQIKSVDYYLFLELVKGSNTFKGKLTIVAELNHLNSDLSIDTMVKKIDSVTLNGKAQSKLPLRKGSFDIPKAQLSKNINIEIIYSSEYTKEIHGFKKSVDTIDGEEYIWSDVEPYYTHWIFPCFNQPDLKAKFSLRVGSPVEWKVLHNELIEKEEINGKTKITIFKQTPPISTYLFFLGAGPYHEWKDQYGNVPLFIHTRKSMKDITDAEKIFDTVKKGLKFFTAYFDYAYPYSKYDQIFIPDLATNAQENPGAVIIHEQYLFRGLVPSTFTSNRDNVMLHEMAHMWFGNLVTMKWWSDLWLKESFATYTATLAIERELKSDFAQLDSLNSKSWGYWQDQLSTTHPIESDIPDVRASKSIFDGITYAKGAAAMKQLHYYVGEDGFKKGIQTYFKKYAMGNADRKEFIDSISASSGKDLTTWSEKWLQTAGANKVKVDFECERGVISSARILQKESPSNNLSPHRISLGLYKLGTSQFTLLNKTDVFYEKAETIIQELNGVACPDFILPNYEDQDYALFGLDKSSLRHAGKALTQLPENLSRYQLWHILMQMVKDLELSPKAFMEMAMEALKFESNETIIGFLSTRYTTYRNFRQQYFQYLSPAQRAAVAPNLEKVLWQRVMTSPPRSSVRLIFFDFYLSIAQTKNSQDRLFEMITKGNTPEGVPMDPPRRWRLIRALAANGHPEAKNLIESEFKKSPSDYNTCMTHTAKASLPDLQAKKETFGFMFKRGTFTQCEYREASFVFNNGNYPELIKPFINDFFKEVTTMNWHSNDDLAESIIGNLFPTMLCTSDLEKISTEKLKSAKNLTSLSRKVWQESHDELSRCVKIRAMK